MYFSMMRRFGFVLMLVSVTSSAMGCAVDARDESATTAPDIVTSFETFDTAVTSVRVDATPTSPHLMLGTPADADASDDYLLTKTNYALSYNDGKHVPNWVAWKLQASDLGSVARKDSFTADHTLPTGFYEVTNTDYKRSGYSRGHMCPSADRTSTAAANNETFLFTNIVPQTTELNSGPWERLETYVRNAASRGSDMYIVSGSLFASTPPTIGNNVAVPSYNYKIVVTLPHGGALADVTATTPIVAVNMPNAHTLPSKAWTDYKVTLAEVERLSGYRFLTALAPQIHDALATAHTVAVDE